MRREVPPAEHRWTRRAGPLLRESELRAMNSPTVDVVFTLDELWQLLDHVREHQAHGREWSKDFMRSLQEAVIEANASTEHKATVTLDAADCWQISRQIPSGLMVGTQNVGRMILLAVFTGLRVLEPVVPADAGEPDAPGESAVPGAFVGAWAADEAAKETFERLYGDAGGG